jgi:mRNA-degrading endonuclease RelE of RelBE toxin-antitoxin system
MRRLDRASAQRVRAAVSGYALTEQGDVRYLINVTPKTWRLRMGDYRVLIQVVPAAPDDEDTRERMAIEHVQLR